MIDEQIVADAATGAFDDWGLSTVIDENIDAPVVSRENFERLHRLAKREAAWPIGNAGLLHVYGYLGSTVETPFGPKSARWLDGALARALGLSGDAFLPDRGDGTLLARVTAAVLPRLLDPRPEVLLTLDQTSLDGSASARTVVIGAPGGGGEPDGVDAQPLAGALLYGVHEAGRMRAITAFPLAAASASFCQRLIDQPPRLRYNAATSMLSPLSPLAASLRTQ